MPRLLRQLHAFINRGMGRYAIEKHHLESAEAQSDQHLRVEFGVRAFEKRANLSIDPKLPAKHTQHESRCEVAVGR